MPKTPSDYPRIQFRPGELSAPLSERTDNSTDRQMSEAARRALEEYFYFLDMCRPAFSTHEASLIVDALNGTFIQHQTGHLLWAEIEDAIRLDQLDGKWEVDGPALVARLKALHPFASWSVEEAARRFWAGSYRKDEPVEEGVKRVGLVREVR